ncbi:MAG: hypothetical protein ABI614_03060 [Planctomycetota bacterium]
MILHGTVKQGVVEFEDGATLPDGTRVAVEPLMTPYDEVPESPDALGWPSGYFEETFGAIADHTFVRPPQGELPKAVDLE